MERRLNGRVYTQIIRRFLYSGFVLRDLKEEFKDRRDGFGEKRDFGKGKSVLRCSRWNQRVQFLDFKSQLTRKKK